MLNSAQHARSAASRQDDVIDRSALEQAREGFRRLGYIEELLIGLRVQKSTLEVRDGRLSPRIRKARRTLEDVLDVRARDRRPKLPPPVAQAGRAGAGAECEAEARPVA